MTGTMPYISYRDLYPDLAQAWASVDERTIPESGEREGYGEGEVPAQAGAHKPITTKDLGQLAGWLFVILVLLVVIGMIT